MIMDFDIQLFMIDLYLYPFQNYIFNSFFILNIILVFILILILFDSLNLFAVDFRVVLIFVFQVFRENYHFYEDGKQYFHEHTFIF